MRAIFSIVLLLITLSLGLGQEVISENVSAPINLEEGFLISSIEAFSVNFVSEIGDKSFIFILYFTVMSPVNKLIILVVSFIAMVITLIFSIVVGYSIPFLLNKDILEWVAILTFAIFGIMQLYEASKMNPNENVERRLQEAKKKGIRNLDSEDDEDETDQNKNLNEKLLPRSEESQTEAKNVDDELLHESKTKIVWTIFSLLVISEWGDKTMFTTIMMSSVFNIYGVLIGSAIAYFLTCTLAVIAGSFLGKYLSERTICIIGGIIFLLFALQYLLHKL